MNKIMFIMCDKCHKLVESWDMHECNHPNKVEVMARCHGEVDIISIPMSKWKAGMDEIRFFKGGENED